MICEFVPLTTLVEVIATVARFVSDALTVTVTFVLAVSTSITLMTEVRLVVASSKMVLVAMPVKYGASLTGVTSRLKVFVIESTPPFATPPLSFITTVSTLGAHGVRGDLEDQRAVGTDGRRGSRR